MSNAAALALETAARLSRPMRTCLNCGSSRTEKSGRTLRCRDCEVTYLIPAVQLAASS